MENYEGAYRQRHQDTQVLHQADRKTAAMHLGGCAIECLLKAMILAQIPDLDQRQWCTKGVSQTDGIKRPGHDLARAVNKHPTLESRIHSNQKVRQWLERVNQPCSGTQSFIDLRYTDVEPQSEEYQTWWDSYTQLCRWLERQIWEL